MSEQITTRLQLQFYNQDGSQSNLSPKYFATDVINDQEKLKKWMDEFSQLNVFLNHQENNALYIEKKQARLIETTVTNLI